MKKKFPQVEIYIYIHTHTHTHTHTYIYIYIYIYIYQSSIVNSIKYKSKRMLNILLLLK